MKLSRVRSEQHIFPCRKDLQLGYRYVAAVAGRIASVGERETMLREFFLRGLPTKMSEFSFTEQLQGAIDLLTPTGST